MTNSNWMLGLLCTMTLSSTTFAADNEGIDLHKAISISLESAGGGKVMEAKKEHENGKQVFEVEILKDGKMTEISIEAATGKIVESSTENFFSSLFNLGEGKQREALEGAKISLEEAITIAQKDRTGQVVEAEAKFKKNQGYYEVTIIADKIETELKIDMANGSILNAKTDAADEDDDDGDKD